MKKKKEWTCPECRSGKHTNCTGLALDEDNDGFVACACAKRGHA